MWKSPFSTITGRRPSEPEIQNIPAPPPRERLTLHLPTHIVSFGYKHGPPAPPTKIGVTHTIIDVRQWFPANPWRMEVLRPLTGLDGPVAAFIVTDPRFAVVWPKFLKTAQHMPRARLTDTSVLFLGCTGGRHRSVYFAERLGKELGVPVEHRDLGLGIGDEGEK